MRYWLSIHLFAAHFCVDIKFSIAKTWKSRFHAVLFIAPADASIFLFSGLILKHGKKYSQTVSKAFHLSAASLDTSSAKSGDIQVLLTSDDNVYILCTLNKDNDKQRSLDLNFAEGDKICFAIKGEGIVHLTGFLVPDYDDDFMDMSDEEEENVADKPKKKGEAAGKKKDKKAEKNPLLKLVSEEADSDSDEMDDTFDPSKAAEEVRKDEY